MLFWGDEMDTVKIGQLIAQTRKEAGLTQRELAGRLHVSDRAVSKWERGINLPEASLFEPLCQCLGLTIPELLRGEREEPTIPALQETLGEAVALVGKKERGSRKYRRWAAVLLALLLASGVFLVRPRWEAWKLQQYYDQDYIWPIVYVEYRSAPSAYTRMRVFPWGMRGPFEAANSEEAGRPEAFVDYPLAVTYGEGIPANNMKLYVGDGWIRGLDISIVGEKSQMEVKLLRWPESEIGDPDAVERGEEIGLYPEEYEGKGVYAVNSGADLEQGYLYALVLSWGDGYFMEFPFVIVDDGRI